MKCRLVQSALLCLLLTATAFATDTLDRVVATVNRKPILASDVEDEAHLEALQQGRPGAALDGERRAVLSRIIERELICQQMPDGFEPSREAIDRRIADMRALFPEAQTGQQWEELLANYGLGSPDLREAVKVQLQVLHFLDIRLRPTVRVDRQEIGDYYSNQLVPKVKAAGGNADPLDKVQDKIEEVLLQQKMTEVFNAWMTNLRNQANIRILDSTLAPPSKAEAEKGARASQ